MARDLEREVEEYVRGGEATGGSAHHVGKELGISTAAAHKVLRSLAAQGRIVATNYTVSTRGKQGQYTRGEQNRRSPGSSTVYVHQQHAHFYEGETVMATKKKAAEDQDMKRSAAHTQSAKAQKRSDSAYSARDHTAAAKAHKAAATAQANAGAFALADEHSLKAFQHEEKAAKLTSERQRQKDIGRVQQGVRTATVHPHVIAAQDASTRAREASMSGKPAASAHFEAAQAHRKAAAHFPEGSAEHTMHMKNAQSHERHVQGYPSKATTGLSRTARVAEAKATVSGGKRLLQDFSPGEANYLIEQKGARVHLLPARRGGYDKHLVMPGHPEHKGEINPHAPTTHTTVTLKHTKKSDNAVTTQANKGRKIESHPGHEPTYGSKKVYNAHQTGKNVRTDKALTLHRGKKGGVFVITSTGKKNYVGKK